LSLYILATELFNNGLGSAPGSNGHSNPQCLLTFAALQVPTRWFLPILATEMLINVLGCLKWGLPLHWLALRYSVCAVLPVALFAAMQVQGRLRFCARHSVRVTGRLVPVLSWA
jgi:hypothetical protein